MDDTQTLMEIQNTPVEDTNLDKVVPSSGDFTPTDTYLPLSQAYKTLTLKKDIIERALKPTDKGFFEKVGAGIFLGSRAAADLPDNHKAGVVRAFSGHTYPNMTEDDAVALMDAHTRALKTDRDLRALWTNLEGYDDSHVVNLASAATSALIVQGIGVGVGLATMNPALAKLATGVIGGAMAAGEASQEYAEDYYVKNNYTMRGYKGGADALYALAHGSISGLIESQLGVENVLSNALKSTGLKAGWKGIARAGLAAAGGEAVEEALQEGSSYLFGSLQGSEDRTFGEFLQDALTNAVYGGIVGGVFGSGVHYTARSKMIKRLKESGYSEDEATKITDKMINDTQQAALKEIATSTSLRANVGEAFDTLVDKIETAMNAADFQDTHTGLSVHEYAVVNASDIASQVIRQARSANVPTADILDLAQIEVVDNAIWLKPQELGTAQDINKRVKDLDKQIRDINSQLRVQSDLRQQLREDKNLTDTLKMRKAGLKRQRDLLKRLYNSKVGIEQEQKEKLTLSKQRYMKKVNPTADVNSFDTVVRKQAYDDVKLLSEDIRALSSNLERQKNAVIAYLAGDDTQLFDNMVLSGKQNIQRGVNSAIESINELMSDPELLNEYRGALKLASDMTLKSQFEEIVADNATFGSSAILHELVHKGSATGLIQSYTAKKQANKDGNNRLRKKGVFNDDDLYYQALKEQNPDSFDGDHCTSKSLTAVLMSRMNQFDNTVDTQVLEQTDLADENARLDDIYPEYKGETIRIIDPVELKQAQFEIVQETNPMQDDYHVGIRSVNDIKTFAETINDEESFVWGDYSREDAQRDLAKNEITVYSSYPIENGVFVSTSYRQAQEYAGGKGKKVYERTVPLDFVAWINGDEGQFAMTDVIGKKRTVYNSNGERIAKSEPALRNFWNWFGDSKVVDEDGRPLVVYHGTKEEFDTFDIKQVGSNTGNFGHIGFGFYFTQDQDYAQSYGANVMPVYLKSTNVFTGTKEQIKSVAKELDESPYTEFGDGKQLKRITDFTSIYTFGDSSVDFTNAVKKLGYDSVFDGDEYVVFESNQIKSTQNRGTFSKDTRNIYYQMDANRGYVGWSRSVRSERAIENNILPKTMAGKVLGIPAAKVPLLPSADTGEWHHTGKFFNKTPHYDVDIYVELLQHKNALQFMRDYYDKTGNFITEEDIDVVKDVFKKNLPEKLYDDLYAFVRGEKNVTPEEYYDYLENNGIDEIIIKYINPDDFTMSSSTDIVPVGKATSGYNADAWKVDFTKTQNITKRKKEQIKRVIPENLYNKFIDQGGISGIDWVNDSIEEILQKIVNVSNQPGQMTMVETIISELPSDIIREIHTNIKISAETKSKMLKIAKKHYIPKQYVNRAIKEVRNQGYFLPTYNQGVSVNGYYDAELKVIVLGRNMNTMTLPHEMAHFWLDNTFSMFKKAAKGELTIGQQWIDETNTLFGILGIDPQQETLTTSQQETFATMTEAVITGLAPVPDGATLPMTEYLNWIPEKYKSIAQIGFRNENGMIVHPVLDQSAVDFFNVWYGNMTLPPIPSSPARDSMTNPRDENGEIIPSTTETMQEREKTISKAIKDQESADESAQDQRKANQSSAEQAETAGALAVYDSAEQEKPTLPEHESWLKAGRGTNTREQLAKAARNYVKKNPDHAREVAQGNPFTTENDTGVDRESLILAVMEMDNITYGTELGVLYEHNIALSRSRAGTELGTHSRTGSYQMYLDAYKRIEAAMTEKAAYKYAGRGAGAVDKFNSDIDALIIKWADKVFSQGMDIGVALRGMMAEASVQFTGEEGVLHQLDLTQAGKTRQVFIAYANRLIKQDIAKAQPNAELQRKLLEMAPKAEKAAIDLNSSDITVAKNAALALRDWSNLVRSEDVSQSMLGKAINTWAPRAMLSGVSTHITNIVSNSIEQTMVRGAIASHYGENIVPHSELDNETARVKTVYNESGMNLTTMITSSDPSLVHGEKYKPLDPKAKTKAIDPLQWLSAEDNLFRIPTYIDVLSRMASRDANGDVNKAKELFRQYASTQPKKINGQDNPLYKKRQEAILVASMATFTQNGKLAGALNKMRDALNQISFKGRSLQLGTMIAPFVKTPANIIESGLRAPYGALKTAYKKLTGGEITIEDVVDTAHFIGFALVGTIAAAFCDYEPPYKGGKYDPNKPYDSIQVFPGWWVKIDTLGVIEAPLRLLLSMRDSSTGAGIRQTISAIPLIGELTDSNLNYALNDPLNYAGGLAYNQIGKLTPTIVRQIAKPIIRETGLSIDTNKNLGRKFARRWGLDESENTVNDFIGLLFNRIKITE